MLLRLRGRPKTTKLRTEPQCSAAVFHRIRHMADLVRPGWRARVIPEAPEPDGGRSAPKRRLPKGRGLQRGI